MDDRIAKRVSADTPRSWLDAVPAVDTAARLRTACAVWMALWTLGLVANDVIAPVVSPERPLDDAWPFPATPIALTDIVVSLALFIHLGRRSRGQKGSRDTPRAPNEAVLHRSAPTLDQHVLNLAAGYLVFIAASIGLVNQWTPNIVGLSWICVLILVYPLIVPDTPRRTLFAAVAAASMDPMGMVVTAARGVPLPELSQLVWAVIPNYLCALLAVVPARLVTRLEREISVARELGSYRLGDRLASGGMGEVYRAEHRLLARPAAIKLIRPELLGEASSADRRRIVARFEREAHVLSLLRSPHTIALYDYGITHDGTLYTVMELLDGLDLDTLVTRYGPVGPARAVYLLRQVCDSLAEAHDEGLIHRDIKPGNVFVSTRERAADFVTVLDFGLVKLVEWAEDPMVTEMRLVGTPAYMSPEQALGQELDSRTDIYSMGCLAYFLLTGRDVFEGRKALEVLSKHVREKPAPPSAQSEGSIPPRLDSVVLACLEKDPGRRPADADELSRLLGESVTDELWTADQARRWWAEHISRPDEDSGGPRTSRIST